ncbi:MAG: hypothetical protein ACLU3F_16785 [Blautia wexlerae]
MAFNQRIYLLRPDVYRVITVYIGDDISKEDAIKVVENLVITENDTMIETAGLYTWSEMVSPEESSGEAVMTSIADNKLLMHQIGEVFDISASGEDRDGNDILKMIKFQFVLMLFRWRTTCSCLVRIMCRKNGLMQLELMEI